ncbi:hypothetical protein [Antrihabitans spumae]|uniref:ABC transporter permease n=1 Tax=Antrihabitans spumae TaxID=3373370 RepID=A0ABW7KSG7_9NOCA
MSTLTGTWRLTLVALRRDRVKLLVWIVGIALITLGMASTMLSEYPTAAERQIAATLIANSPGLLIIRGAAPAISPGGLALSEGTVFWGIFAALMSILAVIRHTRQNEETGRAELVGSGVVSRYAGLIAALIVAVAANILLAGLVSLVLIAKNLPLEGSLAAGIGIGAVGIAYAAIAAVAAQMFESTRTASGLAVSILGVTYLLRGVGDALGTVRADGATISSAWPSWLSPIG